MRKRKLGRKLGRETSHRLAMLSNLAMDLFTHEQIQTTVTRAKETARLANKLMTIARKDSLHARRVAAKTITQPKVLKKLFDDIAKRNSERMSGHTRIYRLPPRRGDGSEMALLQLVDRPVQAEVVEA